MDAPLLHNKVPVNPDAVNTELAQLFTTDIAGTGIVVFNGAALPPAAGLVHPFTVCVTV